MANYNATIRTNYFSVKDEAAFRKLIGSLSAEDTVHLFENGRPDGSLKFGFGCHGNIYGIPADTDDDDDEDDKDAFYDALQSLVSENDAIIITEVGNEKLRYLMGVCTVITCNEIRHIDLRYKSLELAQQVLNNPSFQTQMDY